MKNLLIGIDDTDNKESRGTGFHARKLATELEKNKLARVNGITRHQLYVHPDIPYTSQNSSAALSVKAKEQHEITSFCKSFLLKIAPEGCDIGLCVSAIEMIPNAIIEWGKSAKNKVLLKENAVVIADKNNIFLEGLTGTKDGIIGALAAVGLRRSGNDGRFIWLQAVRELRDIKPGIYSSLTIKKEFGIQEFKTIKEELIKTNINLFLGDWVRPVLWKNKVTLLVERIENKLEYEWKCASKDYVRAVS